MFGYVAGLPSNLQTAQSAQTVGRARGLTRQVNFAHTILIATERRQVHHISADAADRRLHANVKFGSRPEPKVECVVGSDRRNRA